MAGFVKGFNPVIISGSAEWAGSSAWYADERGQAEERPVCKPGKMVQRPEGRGFKSRPVHHKLLSVRWDLLWGCGGEQAKCTGYGAVFVRSDLRYASSFLKDSCDHPQRAHIL